VPAIAVTAYAGEEDRTRASLAGFQRYLAKPFEPSELVSIIAELGVSKR
jgi:CheY-like chemotaxis protein